MDKNKFLEVIEELNKVEAECFEKVKLSLDNLKQTYDEALERTSKVTERHGELTDKLFNAKPSEQIAKLCKGEIVINPTDPNVKRILGKLQELLTKDKEEVKSTYKGTVKLINGDIEEFSFEESEFNKYITTLNNDQFEFVNLGKVHVSKKRIMTIKFTEFPNELYDKVLTDFDTLGRPIYKEN